MTIAGVDDMPAMVVGRNVVDSGHHAAQEMVAAVTAGSQISGEPRPYVSAVVTVVSRERRVGVRK